MKSRKTSLVPCITYTTMTSHGSCLKTHLLTLPLDGRCWQVAFSAQATRWAHCNPSLQVFIPLTFVVPVKWLCHYWTL